MGPSRSHKMRVHRTFRRAHSSVQRAQISILSIRSCVLTLTWLILLVTLGCCPRPGRQSRSTRAPVSMKEETRMPEPVSAKVRALIQKLNSWYRDELDVAECPNEYPGRKPSGETRGWILTYKEGLSELGFEARWNCQSKVYELRKKKEPGIHEEGVRNQ